MDWTRRLLDKHKKVKSRDQATQLWAVLCIWQISMFCTLLGLIQSLSQKDPQQKLGQPNYLISKQQSFSPLCVMCSALIAQQWRIYLQCRRSSSILGWKILWRRKWLPIPVVLANSRDKRSLGGWSMGLLRIRHDWMTNTLISTRDNCRGNQCILIYCDLQKFLLKLKRSPEKFDSEVSTETS